MIFAIQATFAGEPFESWSYNHEAHTKVLSSRRILGRLLVINIWNGRDILN